MASYTFIAHDVTINGGNVNVVGSSIYSIVLTDDDPTIGDPGDTGEMISIDGGAPQPYTFLGLGVTDNSENMIVLELADGTLLAFDTDGGQLENGNTKVSLSELVNDPIVPCFTPGTGILTDTGEVLIEDLQAGDHIVTKDDGLQPIVKIIKRRVSAVERLIYSYLAPVMVKKGAFGTNRPTRDTVVSPQHRFYVSDWRAQLYFGTSHALATARSLINDDTVHVLREEQDVEYIHLILEKHQIIKANGVWTESVLLSPSFIEMLPADAAKELRLLFPEETRDAGTVAQAAAPLLRHYEAAVL